MIDPDTGEALAFEALRAELEPHVTSPVVHRELFEFFDQAWRRGRLDVAAIETQARLLVDWFLLTQEERAQDMTCWGEPDLDALDREPPPEVVDRCRRIKAAQPWEDAYLEGLPPEGTLPAPTVPSAEALAKNGLAPRAEREELVLQRLSRRPRTLLELAADFLPREPSDFHRRAFAHLIAALEVRRLIVREPSLVLGEEARPYRLTPKGVEELRRRHGAN